MLAHIIRNEPNIIEDAPKIRDMLASICVHHFVQQSLPADI